MSQGNVAENCTVTINLAVECLIGRLERINMTLVPAEEIYISIAMTNLSKGLLSEVHLQNVISTEEHLKNKVCN